MGFRILSVFYVFFTCWVLSTNVSATFFSIANAITGGGGGGYGGGGYGGGYGSYANYEMAPPPPPPKPTLGKMIGDKIDGISSLKSMLFGPLLNIATALLNKGGGPAPAPPPAPAPAPAYGGGGGMSYSSAGSPPSASYMSPYGSSGGYSNVNPVSYVQGKSGQPSYQLADKYRYDTAAASQTYVPTYEIQSPSSAEHYQSQTAQLAQLESNENVYNIRKPEHNDAPSITNTQSARQHLNVDSN